MLPPRRLFGRRLVRQRADGALAARADDQRAAERVEQGEAVHQLEVVRDAFAEAEAGIDEDLVARDAGRFGRRDPLLEPVIDLDQDVVVARVLLHRLGCALVMHQDHRDTGCRDHPGRPVVIGQRGHIVDQSRAGRRAPRS